MQRRLTLWAAIGLATALAAGWVLWLHGPALYVLLSDEQAVEALVARAGVWGPLALILCNIVQIVVAPVPGSVVQLAAGYLYGPLRGGIYAALGVLAGAMTAMLLARTLGRPLVRLLVGEARLARWEGVTQGAGLWVWMLLLLGPVGDLPFALAGLTRAPFGTIFLLTLGVRVPFVFFSTAIGGGVLPVVWLLGLTVFVALVMLLGWRYQQPLMVWYMRLLRAPVPAADPARAPQRAGQHHVTPEA